MQPACGRDPPPCYPLDHPLPPLPHPPRPPPFQTPRLSPTKVDRSLHDALCAVKRALESASVVPGGGCVESALSVYLENFATTLGSREQLAIAEFAEAPPSAASAAPSAPPHDPLPHDTLHDSPAPHRRPSSSSRSSSPSTPRATRPTSSQSSAQTTTPRRPTRRRRSCGGTASTA